MNRRSIILGTLALSWLPRAAHAQSAAGGPDLSGYAVGPLPPDFLATWRTGQGPPGEWKVVEDASASRGKAIAQVSADPTDYRFPLAVWEPTAVQEVEATIRVKAVAGRVDRAGGVAVRLRGPDDYYVARANALEGNVNLYRVVGGRRQQIAGARARVSSGGWHVLALRAEGDRLSVFFDGKQVVAAADRTFTGAGKVALWTKADSVTRFDRLEIRSLA